MQCRPLERLRPLIRHTFVTRPSAQLWLVRPQVKKTQRDFSLASIPTVLLPPIVFGGLLVTLWTYKCMMMVIFQNKIIYMPSMPPFSRSEKLSDYARQCRPVEWQEHSIRSLDGTKIKLVEGSIPQEPEQGVVRQHTIVLYFQGNASSTPPRLPYLSAILKLLSQSQNSVQYTFIALAYRGFWTSSGRASERGIEKDAQAALNWIDAKYDDLSNVNLLLWGQSIGAGVASTALARRLIDENEAAQAGKQTTRRQITGLLLETPFTSLRAMLVSLYPQKFLPYRYLWPFLMSTWDSEIALRRITQEDVLRTTESTTKRLHILFLEAGDDELVPKGDAARLFDIARGRKGVTAHHKVVKGALHTDVMAKSEGRKEIVNFIESVTRDHERASVRT